MLVRKAQSTAVYGQIILLLLMLDVLPLLRLLEGSKLKMAVDLTDLYSSFSSVSLLL